MKKTTALKALVLSMIMTLGIVMPMTAQTDDFFKNNNEDLYENRDGVTINSDAIFNQQFGEQLPLGSGLLIFAVAGAGYAVARRRRSLRKTGTMLMALAVVLTFTQCKKRIETVAPSTQNSVHLTLKVDNDSKHDIVISGNPDDIGKVNFELGDKLIVCQNHQTLDGMLEYTKIGDDYVFTGTVKPSGDGEFDPDDYLYFSYINNVELNLLDIDVAALVGNNDYLLSPNIAYQREKLPVVSFGQTSETYGELVDAGLLDNLSCKLYNKCALVRFTLPVETAEVVKLVNVYTRGLLYVYHDGPIGLQTNTNVKGVITLYNPKGINTASNERWGVLLIGDGPTTVDVVVGNKLYKNAVDIPALANNQLVNSQPLQITLNTATAKDLDPMAIFNPTNNSWYIVAKGNLKYDKGTNTFGFLTNQWDRVEEGSVEENYGTDGVVTLFGWGAWGKDYPYGPYNTNEDRTQYTPFYEFDNTLKPDGVHDGWRTQTWSEMVNMFCNRGAVYYSATVNGVPGIVLLTDAWTGTTISDATPGMNGWNNLVKDGADWTAIENAGALFFPTTGYRNGMEIHNYDEKGSYWSSDGKPGSPEYANAYWIEDGVQYIGHLLGTHFVDEGYAVRLIRDLNY